MKSENSLVRSFEGYLRDTLGISVGAAPWQGERSLPFFLGETYAVYASDLLGTPCLLIVPRGGAAHTPAAVKKHITLLREKWNGEIVYLVEATTAYNRKRLIEQKVPFVVPNNQMYLPFLGVDLREHYYTLRGPRARLSPSTQSVVLHALLKGKEETFTPSGLARALGYTAMTLSRVFHELEALGLARVRTQGRERLLSFPEQNRQLWERAQRFMDSPVKKRLWVMPSRKSRPWPKAGLTALAHYSMLAPPSHDIFAVGQSRWKLLRTTREVREYPAAEPGAYELEIWKYDPTRDMVGGFVDPFSLYLSLQGSKDERIESALAHMLEKWTW